MPTRPPPPPVPPLVPPPDPALVWRASSNFICGSSLWSAFSFQNPASVFLGSTCGCFFGGGAGFGGGSGWEGGMGPAGACAKRRPDGNRQTPQRIATQAMAPNLGEIIFVIPPRTRPLAVHPSRCRKFQMELLLCSPTEVYSQA